MAIESIGNIPAYQTVSTIQPQAQTQPVEKSEESAKEGEIAQQTEARPDSLTLSVEGTEKSTTDGEGQGQGGSAEDTAAQKENERLKKAVEDLNKKMHNSVARYGIHEGTNRVTIKLVDKDTDKVIKELPPEKTLDMIAKVWEMAGILVDEKR